MVVRDHSSAEHHADDGFPVTAWMQAILSARSCFLRRERGSDGKSFRDKRKTFSLLWRAGKATPGGADPGPAALPPSCMVDRLPASTQRPARPILTFSRQHRRPSSVMRSDRTDRSTADRTGPIRGITRTATIRSSSHRKAISGRKRITSSSGSHEPSTARNSASRRRDRALCYVRDPRASRNAAGDGEICAMGWDRANGACLEQRNSIGTSQNFHQSLVRVP